jgi:mannose-1-phosphate guanylyltransferase
VVVVTAGDPADAVRAELPELEPWQVVVEPEPKNTAPAVALGTIRCMGRGGGAHDPVIVLPADTWVRDEDALVQGLRRATAAAVAERALVVLSVPADRPATGLGWIVEGEELSVRGEGTTAVRRVIRFVEKPPADVAVDLLSRGARWNAGIFVFRLGYLWYLLGDLYESFDLALQPLSWCLEEGDLRGLAEEWAKLPAISFDHAVLERAPAVLSVGFDAGWADLGSWDSVAAAWDEHEGTRFVANGIVQEAATGNVIWAPGRTVALVGVEGLAVVVTDDAVLVVPRERAQEVREVVKFIASTGRDELL